jgi:protein-tyrosine kinase
MERISEALQRARQERNVSRPAFADALSPAPSAVPRGDRAGNRITYTHTRCVEIPREALARQRVVSGFDPCMYTDAFKILSTHVSQKLSDHNWNTLAITSPNEHEGKTLVAVNLAISLAMESHQTVLLVDADLRRPTVRSTLELGRGPGLSDYLLAQTPVEDLLIHPGIDGLVVLPGGAALLNSSELLGSRQMAQLVRELKNRYRSRIVVFDLPPVLSAADVLAFSPQIDAALLVVEEGRTQTDDVINAAEFLTGTQLIGTVLNKSVGLKVPADKEYRFIDPPKGWSKGRRD